VYSMMKNVNDDTKVVNDYVTSQIRNFFASFAHIEESLLIEHISVDDDLKSYVRFMMREIIGCVKRLTHRRLLSSSSTL
jgi:hypothetical protein